MKAMIENITIYWFKNQASKAAKKVFTKQYRKEEIQEIINNYWRRYLKLKPEVPEMPTLGGSIMLQLAAMSKAFYDEMIKRGASTKEATQLFYDISWIIYEKMGRFSWRLAKISKLNKNDRLLKATQLFRAFPFNSPSYEWEDVVTEKNIVAFNCTKCPVAEYFQESNMSEFCVKTWCALDYPLAEMWESRLERGDTISAGASKCDFRWIGVDENVETITKN